MGFDGCRKAGRFELDPKSRFSSAACFKRAILLSSFSILRARRSTIGDVFLRGIERPMGEAVGSLLKITVGVCSLDGAADVGFFILRSIDTQGLLSVVIPFSGLVSVTVVVGWVICMVDLIGDVET